MEIKDIVKDCEATVEFYAHKLYDWDSHFSDEKQSLSDVNKRGGFLKIFEDINGNKSFVLEAKNPSILPKRIKWNYTDETVEKLNELILKKFFFISYLKKDDSIENMEYPNEIFLNFDEAILKAKKLLIKIR